MGPLAQTVQLGGPLTHTVCLGAQNIVFLYFSATGESNTGNYIAQLLHMYVLLILDNFLCKLSAMPSGYVWKVTQFMLVYVNCKKPKGCRLLVHVYKIP